MEEKNIFHVSDQDKTVAGIYCIFPPLIVVPLAVTSQTFPEVTNRTNLKLV